MTISELDLWRFDFKKIVVSPEEAGTEMGYYYYELELSSSNTDFCLISMESDMVKDDNWKVKLFQTDDYVFDTREELREFVEFIFKFKKVADEK